MRIMVLDNKKAWDFYSDRYLKQAHFSYETVDFGDPRCKTDETLHLLPDVSGKRVLELGCGGGNVGIALAKRGAKVTAIDISSAQLQIAKQKAKEHQVSVEFIESDIETFNYASYGSFDLVISVCAFQYVADLPDVFNKIFSVLNPSGVFVFSTDDPIFYSVATNFLWDEPGLQSSYFYSGEETWKWEEGDKYSFTSYRHPIDFYINTLINAGFSIEQFHELPVVHQEATTKEELLEELFPRIMVFKCSKRVNRPSSS